MLKAELSSALEGSLVVGIGTHVYEREAKICLETEVP